MNNSYSHFGKIEYNLDVSLQANVLELNLIITKGQIVKKYKNIFINDSLPTGIKKEIKTVDDLFIILGKEKNFTVDPVKGQILLLLKRLEFNEVHEKEVEINLKFVGEEKKEDIIESNIFE